jgi:RIO-like serine/threonine protein kinase
MLRADVFSAIQINTASASRILMTEARLLKKDLFGEVWHSGTGAQQRIIRDTRTARPWLRWLARRLLRREARALAELGALDGIPQLIESSKDRLVRHYIEGVPMYQGRPSDPDYYRRAAVLLRQLHRANVTHNDLAKEPNILVTLDGTPAFIDFQLAWHCSRRNRLFRLLAYEDLRHLLKHKRSYCKQHLTCRELKILANRSVLSRAWMATVKPVYLFISRRIFGWEDREGVAERNRKDNPG